MNLEDMFYEIMAEEIRKGVEKTANDLRYKNMELNTFESLMAFYVCFQTFSFNFMRAVNLVLNGADADKMGNVNEFINDLEAYYLEFEDVQKAMKEEE